MFLKHTKEVPYEVSGTHESYRSECQVPENFYKHLFDLLIESLLSGNQVPDQMRGECRAYKQNAVKT